MRQKVQPPDTRTRIPFQLQKETVKIKSDKKFLEKKKSRIPKFTKNEIKLLS